MTPAEKAKLRARALFIVLRAQAAFESGALYGEACCVRTDWDETSLECWKVAGMTPRVFFAAIGVVISVVPCRINPFYSGPSQCARGTVGCTVPEHRRH